MTVSVCHASDWHGSWQELPHADVYVFTGDMCPNFPDVAYRNPADGHVRWIGYSPDSLDWNYPTRLTIDGQHYVYDMQRRVYPDVERACQKAWAAAHPLTPFLKNPDADVVLVRGNHDFIPLSYLFAGFDAGRVHEIHYYDVLEVRGLRFGGTRGIPFIAGEWSDEFKEDEMREIIDLMPTDIDVLVTHAPPYGMLDALTDVFGKTLRIGCPQISRYVLKRRLLASCGGRGLRAHLFGHNHSPAVFTDEQDTVFSNGACSHNLLDL